MLTVCGFADCVCGTPFPLVMLPFLVPCAQYRRPRSAKRHTSPEVSLYGPTITDSTHAAERRECWDRVESGGVVHTGAGLDASSHPATKGSGEEPHPAQCHPRACPPQLSLHSEAQGWVLLRWLRAGLVVCLGAQCTSLALFLTSPVHDAALWGPLLFGPGTLPITGPQDGNAYVGIVECVCVWGVGWNRRMRDRV
jgi:hypothetical protein